MEPRPRLTAQVVFGLFVIAIGVIFTLDNLEVIDAAAYLRYWPAALIVVGVLKLSQARQGHGWFGGAIFVALGTWMLLERIVYLRIDLSDIWPLLIVCLGGYMVWRGMGGSRRRRTIDDHAYLSAFAVMAGVARGSNSPEFAGADLTAVMGGCEIDLRQASIAPGTQPVIDVFAFWGGIDIRVPEDWTVISRVTPLMGGIEDRTRPAQAAAATRVEVRGVAIMGGIVIKN